MATTPDILPKIGTFIVCKDATLYIVALDLDEGIWTCIDKETGELQMWSFDENGNSAHITIDGIEWPDANTFDGCDDQC